jgi:hypothetical protein
MPCKSYEEQYSRQPPGQIRESEYEYGQNPLRLSIRRQISFDNSQAGTPQSAQRMLLRPRQERGCGCPRTGAKIPLFPGGALRHIAGQ